MRKPSPSLVISILALVMATTGSAMAAKVLIRSSSQIKAGSVNGGDIKNGSIARRDLRNNLIDSSKVRDGSLSLDDLSSSARNSISRAGTQALEAFRKSGPENNDALSTARVVTFSNIPPGTYAIFAKTILTPLQNNSGLLKEGESVAGHCKLDASGDVDESRTLLATPGALSPGALNMQITRSFASTGTVTMDCSTNVKWRASDSSVIAIRLGEAPRSPVDG